MLDKPPIFRYTKLMNDYDEKFAKMRAIGIHASRCLDMLEKIIVPGMSTMAIDSMVVMYAMNHGLICAPFNYKGFPAHCCTSVNHVICHGIPTFKKILKDGDIIKVDVTFKDKDGWHGDSCRTYAVGTVSVKAERLMKVTKNALDIGIFAARPGNTIGHIGHAIQTYIESEGFSTVREYVGHGIGQEFHTFPHVYHYYQGDKPGMSVDIVPGMIFTIEPMINVGKPGTKTLKDGWTVVTKDKSLSAQYEHTIGITEGDPIVFTAGE